MYALTYVHTYVQHIWTVGTQVLVFYDSCDSDQEKGDQWRYWSDVLMGDQWRHWSDVLRVTSGDIGVMCLWVTSGDIGVMCLWVHSTGRLLQAHLYSLLLPLLELPSQHSLLVLTVRQLCSRGETSEVSM